MGYYFLPNEALRHYLNSRVAMLWVGEHAFETALGLLDNLKQFEAIDHKFILFDRPEKFPDNSFFREKLVVISEEFPVWEDDYELEKLTAYLREWSDLQFSSLLGNLIVVGDPTELLMQAYVRMSMDISFDPSSIGLTDIPSFSKSKSFLLLNSDAPFIEMQREAEELKLLVNRHYKETFELNAITFDWDNFLLALNPVHTESSKSKKLSIVALMNKKFRND
jgi:hypothetical protein